MPTRKNVIRDLFGDAPAHSPGLATEAGGFDGAVPAPADQVERRSLRLLSTHPGEAAAPASSLRDTLKHRARQMSRYLEPATTRCGISRIE
ncbi:hypothetical protein [Bradyrhizobium sp. Arg816]|uniref:hypothetical protein n=1 Tax=Bradyrhizobium sp. Arg816 TaxID=2998491 RepID=UPI00249DDFF7|nr:hypothetical protein [Bradyrhizobium sp. Arg816]MDI3560631.1 hypothetical protein [Bradyrhizobium sp. Arg816]